MHENGMQLLCLLYGEVPINGTLIDVQRRMCSGYALRLLLLRSPATSLGLTILGESFACVTDFNPTIEVVLFRLRGWWCVMDALWFACIHPSRA